MTQDVRAGLDACTRCGLCLQACPTYRDLKLEADSPRGRVFLMKQVVDGDAQVDATLAEHLYVCLGCRACETACPSGVPFGSLLEFGRDEVERHGQVDPSRFGWRVFRRIALQWVLGNPSAFAIAMSPARLLQHSPWLARVLAALPLPQRVRNLVAMLPKPSAVPMPRRLPERTAPQGERLARVGLLTGCVMGALFESVHAALIRVLRHNGCEVIVPNGQWCCGALHLHAGDREGARVMARRNITAFEAARLDAIVLDSAGCGAAMKEYGALLEDDPDFGARAAEFSARVRDVSEFLMSIGPRRDFGVVERRVTYQDACHLAHAQRVRKEPRALLAMIPGIELVEMPDSDRCCGAAGIYSLTHPKLATRILEEKMTNVASTGAVTVVVSNPGCHMQLLAGAARFGPRVTVQHLVELLDEAYATALAR
jgi:glycolate oxidase iron-sulfur subunit